jgi:hypothetical protein
MSARQPAWRALAAPGHAFVAMAWRPVVLALVAVAVAAAPAALQALRAALTARPHAS